MWDQHNLSRGFLFLKKLKKVCVLTQTDKPLWSLPSRLLEWCFLCISKQLLEMNNPHPLAQLLFSEGKSTKQSLLLHFCMLTFHKIGNLCKAKAPQQSVLTISACAHVQYWMYCVLCSLFPLLVLCSMLVSRFWTKKLPSYLNFSYKQSNKSMSNLFNKSTSDCLKL